MKRLKRPRVILLILGLCVGLCLAFVAVSAADEEVTLTKTIETIGGIELHSAYYPLENYAGQANTGKTNIVRNSIIGIGNGAFWVAKFIYQGIDWVIEFVGGSTVLEDWIDTGFSVANQIWEGQQATLLPFILAVVASTLVWQLFVSPNLIAVFQTIFYFVVVFICATVFLKYGGTITKGVNEIKNVVESSIVGVGTDLTGQGHKIEAGKEKDATTTITRNALFDMTIERPYLVMNYGTTDKAVIEEGKLKDEENRIESLLAIKRDEESEKALNKAVAHEAKKLKNNYMANTDTAAFSKLGVGLISCLSVIGIGAPLVILYVSKLYYEVMIIVLAVVLGLSFFVSLIPALRNSWLKPLTKIMSNLFNMTVVSIYVLIILVLVTIVDKVIVPDSIGAYLANLIVFGYLLWKVLSERDELVHLMTGGKVNVQQANQSEGLIRKAGRFTRNRALKKMAKNSKPEKKKKRPLFGKKPPKQKPPKPSARRFKVSNRPSAQRPSGGGGGTGGGAPGAAVPPASAGRQRRASRHPNQRKRPPVTPSSQRGGGTGNQQPPSNRRGTPRSAMTPVGKGKASTRRQILVTPRAPRRPSKMTVNRKPPNYRLASNIPSASLKRRVVTPPPKPGAGRKRS